MTSLNNMLHELKNVPADRLEDLYSIVRSFRANAQKAKKTPKRILKYAGSFSDMADKDYSDFRQETISIRKGLFKRDFHL
ncbi:hypothetical protein BH20BAC1_BH20BAC1_03530 [soil metagenome]